MARSKRTRTDATADELSAPDVVPETNEVQEPEVDEPPAKRTRRNPKRTITEKPKPAPKAPAVKKARSRAAGKGKAKEVSEEPAEEPAAESEPPTPKAPVAKKPRGRPAGKGKAKKVSEEPTEESEPTPEAEAGPSNVPESAVVTETRPKKKRAPKKAPQAAEVKPREEKRKAEFLHVPPEATVSRLWTLRCERIFLVDRTRNNGELKEAFSVLGTTGNVYTVTIDQKPRCNCPDHVFRRNHCKHLIFVFFKVLQVGENSPHWYQKALLSSELEQIFASAPIAPNSMAHPHVLAAHAKATGKIGAESSGAGADAGNRRIPTEEDDCPVCYEGMHEVEPDTLEWCIACGNALHKECFAQWKRSAAMKGNPLTCVWCRADWTVQEPANVLTSRNRMGYLNLAAAAYAVSCECHFPLI